MTGRAPVGQDAARVDQEVEQLPNVPTTRADRIAYAFYAAAVTAALVGQVWAAVDHIPWPAEFWGWLRPIVSAPGVAVIELGGVATAMLADDRRRKGEKAYAYRTMSALIAAVAVAINVFGHLDVLYLAIGFGGLSAFAYVLYLAHSAARMRDALRAAGKLAKTPPRYGWRQWRREPEVTRLARTLAQSHGYGIQQSLAVAREQIRTRDRRRAIAATVEQLIREEHKNPLRAKIAATTYDMDRLAVEIEARADYAGWAAKIGSALSPGEEHATVGQDAAAPERPTVGQPDTIGQDVTEGRAVPEVPEVRTPDVRAVPEVPELRTPDVRAVPEPRRAIEMGPVPEPARPVVRHRPPVDQVAPDSAAQERAAARKRYRESVEAGRPLTGAQLAREFGKGDPKWGLRRVQEATAEIQAERDAAGLDDELLAIVASEQGERIK
ncbi:hypothetical protein GA0070616_0016 [Micromonospora nigra]|uniref:Uncharacterized protein n=2 Tax=Micromonospora nigra TaxID=145857 RepID=A0A1C6R721_9ACTN|nr:hypothetical protein GA0070616_0016 [Micromonospora nigra]